MQCDRSESSVADLSIEGIDLSGIMKQSKINGISQSASSASLFLTLFVTVYAQNQVLLLPSPIQVAYAGGLARLECLSGFIDRTTTGIEFFLNETLTISSFDGVTGDISRGGNNAIRGSVLRFEAVPVEYNMTRIHCHVEFNTGDPINSTTTVLLLQGLLDAVDLMILASEDFTVFLNWTAPFTLLGASEITYCVDVVDLTTRRALLSECGTNITEFTYTAMLRDFVCGDLSFTVTPVNVVGNGTSATVGLTNLSSNPLTPPELVNLTKTTPTELMLVMSAPVCYIELRFVDVDTKEIIALGGTDVNVLRTNFVVSSQQLGERDYNVTIVASNLAGNATSRTTLSLGTNETTIDGTRNYLSTRTPTTRKHTTSVLDTDVYASGCCSNSYSSLLVTIIIVAMLSWIGSQVLPT